MNRGELLMAYWAQQQNANYITDGLIFQLDGINNTGNGHSASATTWVDLIGGNNVPIDTGYVTWESNRASLTTAPYMTESLDNIFSSSGYCTYEVVCKFSGELLHAWVMRIRGGNGNFVQVSHGYSGNNSLTYDYSGSMIADSNPTYVALTAGASYVDLYEKGVLGKTFVQAGQRSYNCKLRLFAYETGSLSGTGTEIFAIRIYDRALTSAEIANNYAVDKRRFNLA